MWWKQSTRFCSITLVESALAVPQIVRLETDHMMHGRKQRKVVGVIQARMASTRLPGKVMEQILDRPMLSWVVERLQSATLLDEVIVATTQQSQDDIIVSLCQAQEIPCFRGSEADVLDRYYLAARRHNADVVVRVTSDCPLIDSGIVDKVVQVFLAADVDYASNTVIDTYPRGLDAEVLTFAALERAHRDATRIYQREHVTPYIYENPSKFRILSVTAEADYSSHRWTVDTAEDLALVRAIYQRLGSGGTFREILNLVDKHPELSEMNSSISQKALREA
jgi:spore coat polysaccharide biosynthesis protein SpsF